MLAALLFFALHYLARSVTHETTDNAFLDGDIVSVAPRISGEVNKVCVVNNQMVKAGDLLAEIDPRDYQIQLEQKKSAFAAAERGFTAGQASLLLAIGGVLAGCGRALAGLTADRFGGPTAGFLSFSCSLLGMACLIGMELRPAWATHRTGFRQADGWRSSRRR